jgi:hypothetical protein
MTTNDIWHTASDVSHSFAFSFDRGKKGKSTNEQSKPAAEGGSA